MSEKTKRQHSLPNRQLAKAFAFSADDLAANRLGFMSHAQSLNLPLWSRSNIALWLDNQVLRAMMPRLAKIEKVCGKIRLEAPVHDVHGGRVLLSNYVLLLAEANLRFSLNQAQYQALKDSTIYQVYYSQDPLRILSLETISQCEG